MEIPSPKDIEVKEISSSSANIFWKIDKLNIINFDNEKIKFRIEIRKDKDKFLQIYEGKETNFQINNLIRNTEYEFRICSVYDDIIGLWTKNIKFKTLEVKCDSIILLESKRENEFINKIKEWTGYNRMELIYRGSRDGSLSKNFHEKCDYKAPTITLYKNVKGCIFGGYASIAWTSDGSYHKAPECFIFTLTNIHNTEPTKFPTTNNNEGTRHHIDMGPSFGENCDISIKADYINIDSYSDFPCRYSDILGKGKSIFTGDFNNNNTNYRLKEIEVFQLFK